MRTAKLSHERARESGYLYVLHFEEKLGGKAMHYIGCTSDPLGRLTCHAHGQSSSIMRACMVQGVEFVLGALGQTHRRGMRRIEKQAKAWKNAAEFCEVCSASRAKAIPGTRPMPLDMLPFSRESRVLKIHSKPKPVQVSLSSGRTPIYLAEDMKKLASEEKDALGFIPMGGAGGVNEYMVAGRIVLALQGRELVGYLLFGVPTTEGVVTVHQTIVTDRVRGTGIGRRMLMELRKVHPKATLKARVRDDLEANGFWRAVGFSHIQSDTHDTSGAQLNVWVQYADPDLFPMDGVAEAA